MELLVSTNVKQRKALLETITDVQLNFLSTILKNILQSNIVLDSVHLKKLTRHAAVIRRLAQKSTTASVKRTLLSNHNRLVCIIFRPLVKELKQKLTQDGR